ncbi:MAG: hypothetical protein JNL69_03680 [Bacteroidia bacterium]|nr:hypothetical protein [Bacteroidia bacterium]
MPLTEFFLDYFPGYNKFRAVSMMLVLAEFAIPILAVLALDKLFKNKDVLKEKIQLAFVKKEITTQNAFLIALGLTGGLSLMFYLMPGLTSLFAEGEYDRLYNQIAESNGADIAQRVLDNIEISRKALFKADAIRSFFFIAMAAVTIWLYLKGKMNKVILIPALGLLILFDLALIDKGYLNDKSFASKQEAKIPFPETKADKEILQDTHPNFRVLNIAANTFNESATSFRHKSIGGYHAAKLRRYQELIEAQIQPSIQDIISTLRSNPTDSALRATFAKQGVLNMLNTKYIIYNNDAPPLQNRYALGNAWFVSDVKMVANADEELKSVGEINPAVTAVVDERYKNELEGFSVKPDVNASLLLKEYLPNKLTYESNVATEQLAVFSEIYYPNGWNAYVDGELKPHFGVDWTLRAMRIPEGKHTIVFKFEPTKYYTGEKISLVSCLLLFAFVGGGLFMAWKKKEVE